MSFLDRAILKTLAYADIFDYPLTVEEIHRYLITAQSTAPISIKRALKRLIAKEQVGQSQEFYFLIERAEVVKKRIRREQISKQTLQLLNPVIKKASQIPTIHGIFLTGALAMENAAKNDDLDLMIITKNNALWTTRLIVTILLQLLGKRRLPNQHHAPGKICVNLWLDETALAVPKKQQNLYTAHEVIQAKSLLNRHKIHQRFLQSNLWVRKYLANAIDYSLVPTSKNTVYPLPIFYKRIIETVAYRAQKWYMQSKQTRELVTPHAAYFHPRDSATVIIEKYHDRLKTLK